MYHMNYDDVVILNNAVVTALTTQGAATVNGMGIAFINYVTEHDEFTTDRISATFEHPLYVKVTTFEGTANS